MFDNQGAENNEVAEKGMGLFGLFLKKEKRDGLSIMSRWGQRRRGGIVLCLLGEQRKGRDFLICL